MPETVVGKTTLIFPAGMPGSLAHLHLCQSNGSAAIGASSLSYDPNADRYADWAHLPFLADPAFDTALDALIDARDITDIFTPHPIVWDHLNSRLEAGHLPVSLSKPPAVSDSKPYHLAMAASDLAPLPLSTAEVREPLSKIEITALLYHAEKIPGMCDHDKTRGLIEMFRDMPPGDVVEIGSWWGKSAFILHRLAQLHGTGSLLCIDPWDSENFVQNDATGLVDRMVADLDADEAHCIFTINLLPYARHDVNYLRMPAQQALATFREVPEVESPEFGQTRYTGRVAALHIDGNHAYDNAKADIVGWTSLVVDGGWIVIDDYVWPWGDGPQRAGDEFLSDHADDIACAFVMGTALFIKLRTRL
jgi:hypothetical protein